jgi:hypothetical protein
VPTIETAKPTAQAVGGTATITVTSSWAPLAPRQEVGGLESHVQLAETAAMRVLEKYPETLRRLA